MKGEKNSLHFIYLMNVYCSTCNVLSTVLGTGLVTEYTKMNKRVSTFKKLRT